MESKLREKLPWLIGMAFFCAMLRPPFFGSLTPPDVSSPQDLRITYDVLIIFCGILVFAVYTPKKPTSLSVKPFGWFGVTAFVGAMVMNAGRFFFNDQIWVIASGAVLVALGFSFLAMGWISSVARYCRDLALPMFAASFVLSHLFGFFDLLPRDIEAAVVSFYPLLSSMFLFLSSRQGHEEMRVAQSSEEAPNQYFRRLQWLAMILVVAEIACGSLLRVSYAHGGTGYIPGPTTVQTYAGSAIIGIVAYLIVRRENNAFESVLIVGSVCLAPMLLSSIGFTFLPKVLLVPLVTGATSMFTVLMMGLASLWYRDDTMATERCAGAAVALYGLSVDTTFIFLPRVLGIHGSISQGQLLFVATSGIVVIALGVSFCLLALVILQKRELAEATEMAGAFGKAVTTADSGQVGDEIVRQFGLTEREGEVAKLIARGYTSKRIAEDLVISLGTVQSHSKNIYKKLGIHKKDELIEIFETEDARSRIR
jgi:DNA-binding CsgD family transcriptional regulator